MQDLQPILGTGQLERSPPRKSWFQLLPLIAVLMAIAGGGCLFFEYAIKLRLSTCAAREDIADAKIRQWVPPNAKSIEMRRRLHRPLLLVEASVTETDFRVWCERGAFELHELDPDELPPSKGVKNGLRYRGAHDGVDAIYDRDQGKFILMQYGFWFQFPPDRNALRND